MDGRSVLAIDLATKTGLAEGRPGAPPRLRTIEFAQGDDLSAFYGELTLWMAAKLRDDPPDLIAIEEPVPPSAAFGHTNHDTTMRTIGGYAIIAGIIKCKSIPCHTVRVATWRKHFIGGSFRAGGAGMTSAQARKENKAAVIRRCKLLGWHPEDDNQGDAAGIWDWACATHLRALPEKLHLFREG